MLCLALAVPAASAQAQTSAGGAYSSPAPKLSGIECQTLCSGPMYARAGSTVALTGRGLDSVTVVTFLGRARAGDEVEVQADQLAAKQLVVTVPAGAAGGRITVTSGDGVVSRPSAARLRVERVAPHRASSGPGPAIDIAVSGRKVFFDGERHPTLTYVLHDSGPVHALVQVVRVADGAVVTQWDEGMVAAGEMRIISWDGSVDGTEAPDGLYVFNVVAQSSTGAMATTAQATPAPPPQAPPPDSFMLLGHKFPVRGKHDFGEFAASFGGGRGHKGQDIFAECGTPLVAARGGVVKLKRYHTRAGNYIVIDTEQSDVDQVYMHLRYAALVDQRDRVRTGQPIGFVGDTGHASGCHLHFEQWTGPGWYSGGSPFDPLPDLQAWDAVS